MTLEESVERELKAIECLIPFPCKTRLYINNLKHQIFNMRCCYNCESHRDDDAYDVCKTCHEYSEWELTDENN